MKSKKNQNMLTCQENATIRCIDLDLSLHRLVKNIFLANEAKPSFIYVALI